MFYFKVFYNLGTLPEVLTKLLDTSLTRFKNQASDLLDIRLVSAPVFRDIQPAFL